MSKALDDRGVDIVDPTNYIHQCKVNSKKSFNCKSVLDYMVKRKLDYEIPVVHMRQREKRGSRFYNQAEISFMYTNDLLNILAELEQYRNSETNTRKAKQAN